MHIPISIKVRNWRIWPETYLGILVMAHTGPNALIKWTPLVAFRLNELLGRCNPRTTQCGACPAAYQWNEPDAADQPIAGGRTGPAASGATCDVVKPDDLADEPHTHGAGFAAA